MYQVMFHPAETKAHQARHGTFVAGPVSDSGRIRETYVASMRHDPKKSWQFNRMQKPLIQAIASWEKLEELRSIPATAMDYSTRQQYEQLTRFADVNADNIHQGTIVRFMRGMIGRLEVRGSASQAYVPIGSPSLRGKVPEMGNTNIDFQVDRLFEAVPDYIQFGQTEYQLRRNEKTIWMDKESQIEATINPFQESVQQAEKVMLQARDLQGIVEASKMAPGVAFADIETITDPIADATGSIAIPRAGNYSGLHIARILQQHFKDYGVRLDRTIINPITYGEFKSNYYARKTDEPMPAPLEEGIVPFVGLDRLNAYLDPWCPMGYLYCMGAEGSYRIDGPKSMDSDYDMRKYANFHIARDFIGYLLVNEERFCKKLRIEGTKADLTAATLAYPRVEDEITTFKQARKLLARTNLKVKKNPDA